ncbi:MAG: hypothetical protein NVSMB22_03520 [Chloroflexota bacterium]
MDERVTHNLGAGALLDCWFFKFIHDLRCDGHSPLLTHKERSLPVWEAPWFSFEFATWWSSSQTGWLQAKYKEYKAADNKEGNKKNPAESVDWAGMSHDGAGSATCVIAGLTGAVG